MRHYIGLDISMKTTFVCVISENGDLIKEVELPTDGKCLAAFIKGATNIEESLAGMETGSFSRALIKILEEEGINVHCLDARKVSPFLKRNSHKNDRNDARVIADLIRTQTLEPVYQKSEDAVEIKTVLKGRHVLVDQKTEIKNSIRGILKHLGLKLEIGSTTVKSFSRAVRKLISHLKTLEKDTLELLLCELEHKEESLKKMDSLVSQLEKKHEKVVSLFKSVDAIGPITALAFYAEIDNPKRFKDGRSVGAYIGCVPTLYESGERSVYGHISKQGPAYLRSLLHEAGIVLLTRIKVWSHLKRWGLKIQRQKGTKKAAVAVARKLATVLWKIWMEEKPFHRSLKEAKAAA